MGSSTFFTDNTIRYHLKVHVGSLIVTMCVLGNECVWYVSESEVSGVVGRVVYSHQKRLEYV